MDEQKNKQSESESSVVSSDSNSSSSEIDSSEYDNLRVKEENNKNNEYDNLKEKNNNNESNEYDNLRVTNDNKGYNITNNNDNMIKINIDNNTKNNNTDNNINTLKANKDRYGHFEKKMSENLKSNLLMATTPKTNRHNYNQENTFRYGSINKSIDKNKSIKSPKNSLLLNSKNQNDNKIMLSPNEEFYNNLKQNEIENHRVIKSVRDSQNLKIIEQIKKEKKEDFEDMKRRNSVNSFSERRISGSNVNKYSKTQESFNKNSHNNSLNNNNNENKNDKNSFKKSRSKPLFNQKNPVTPYNKKRENNRNVLKTPSNMKQINQNFKKMTQSLNIKKFRNQKFIQPKNLISKNSNNNSNNNNNISNNNLSNNINISNNDINNNNTFNYNHNVSNKEDNNEESYVVLREKFLEFLKRNSNGNMPNYTKEEEELDEKLLRNLAKNEIPIENENLDNIKCTNNMREFLTESLNNFKLLRMKEKIYEINGDDINDSKFDPRKPSLLGLIQLDYENENDNENKGTDNILEPLELEKSTFNLGIRQSFVNSFKGMSQTILPSVEKTNKDKRVGLFK